MGKWNCGGRAGVAATMACAGALLISFAGSAAGVQQLGQANTCVPQCISQTHDCLAANTVAPGTADYDAAIKSCTSAQQKCIATCNGGS